MKRTTLRLIFLISAILCAQGSYAHTEHQEDPQGSPIRFIENKNQWEQHIAFAADIPLGRVFLEAGKLTYNFCDVGDLHERWFHRKASDPFPFTMDCHAFTVEFVGGNPQALILGQDQAADYQNYFIGNDRSRWASKVGLYDRVVYKDIYPGIDFVIYGKGKGLKYDFIVRPGADPNLIRMRYSGLDALRSKAGALLLETSILDIREEAPIAFQGDHVPIRCAFDLQENELRFVFPAGYDQKETLTIDPNMVFSTFTGSVANNFGFTATYDDDGNLYAGGIAYGQGYPVTTGAYETTFQGGSFDVSISKFNATGGHLYSTYVGGNGADQPHSMVVDGNGDLLFMGRSSSGDYPTPNGYDNSHNGGFWDIIVSKLNENGTQLLGSTYIGGNGDDAMNMTTNFNASSIKYNYGDDARGEIVVDDAGNAYIAACTQSQNFPWTPGALQTQIGSQQDGCVFKLSPDMSTLVWSTFLGGDHDDAAYSLKVDQNGGVFVTGGTRSINFHTSNGALHPGLQGGIDGFVVHLNNTGTGLIAGTYIGTADYNQCYFIELDKDEDVYVMGQKTGAFPITAGAWSTGQGGQFIMKLTNDLSSTVYSTVFGTTNSSINIAPTAFLVDVCEFVYVSGWGGATNFQGATNGLPVTQDAYQLTTDGSDLYIIVLEKDAVALDFATFVGGNVSNEHVDGGTSRFNKKAEIYQSVCAGCWSNSDFPTTPGAFSSNNNSTGCNLACFKMELSLPGILAEFSPVPDTAGCAPHTVLFDNTSSGGNQFIWNFDDPASGAQNTSFLFQPTHTFQNPGTYNVMLVAIDSNSCNIVDTTYQTITVYPVPVATVTPDTSVCDGSAIPLIAGGGQSYSWSPATGLSNPTGATTFASPTQTTTYTVTVMNPGGCSDQAQVTVTVLPVPTANAGQGGFICPGDSLQLAASGGQGYSWSPAGSLTDPGISNPVAFPTQTTNYVVTVTAPNGCTDDDTVQVEVSAVQAQPGADIDLCIGETTQLNGSGGGSYQWFPPTGLSSTTISNPTVNISQTTTYYLTVTDGFGCQHTDSVTVTVHPLPTVNSGPDLIMCEHDTVQLTASGAQNYSWTPPNSLSNPNIANPLAFPTTNTTYTVVGTDQFGCEDTADIFIEVLPAPNAVAWGDGTICADSTIQVFASGGISYDWSPMGVFNDPTLPNPIATLGSTTDLVVTVYAANGCDDKDTVHIDVTPTPEVVARGDRLVCKGHSATLFATGDGDTFLWSTGQTGQHVQVTPDSTTAYTVVTFVDGCPSKPDTVVLTVDDNLPFADFFPSPDSGLIPLTVSFANLSTGSVSWGWDFADGNGSSEFSPTHTFQDTGRFDVRLIGYNANGCPDTAYHRIIVGADFTIYVPNAFTPNGDGLNDYWETPWIGVKDYHVMLFDRWGMLIYESRNPDFRWYGVFKGNPAQEGVYTYVITAKGHLGEKVKRAGTVTLMR